MNLHTFAEVLLKSKWVMEECENCLKPATIFCEDCGNSYCKNCCQSRHQNERWKNHTLNVIAVKVSQESSQEDIQEEEEKEQNEGKNKGSARLIYTYRCKNW